MGRLAWEFKLFYELPIVTVTAFEVAMMTEYAQTFSLDLMFQKMAS